MKRGRADTGSSRASSQRPKRPAGENGEVEPLFAPVAAAFAGDREVGLGRMFSSSSVLNVRGKIFAMLARGKFVAKLPKARVDALVASGAGTHFDPGHGRLMKEWIALEGRRSEWVALAKEAHAFVRGGKK
jgi:hypothetical protein